MWGAGEGWAGGEGEKPGGSGVTGGSGMMGVGAEWKGERVCSVWGAGCGIAPRRLSHNCQH